MTHAPICCQVYERRGDEQAEIVRVRLEGAGADLHAADSRYHVTCYQIFTSERNIKAAIRRSATSNTLATLYKEKGGVDCNRSRLVNSLKEIMGDEIMILSSPGVATMLILKSKAATVLHLDEVDQDGFDLQVKAVAGKTATETKTLEDKFLNNSNIDRENVFAFGETLLNLLSHISPNLQKSLPAAMIGSIITSIITTKATMFQIGLGLVAHHKPIIEQLHEYRVTSTCREVRSFKI